MQTGTETVLPAFLPAIDKRITLCYSFFGGKPYRNRKMIILSKKQNLILGIVAVIFALGLFVGAFCLVYFHDLGEIQSKEYTLTRALDTSLGKSRVYEIYVEQETEPLVIQSMPRRFLDEAAMDGLNKGDSLQCKVVNGSKYTYEIVELYVNGTCVLSLNDTKKAYRDNAITGCCLVGAGGVLAAVFSGILLYRSKHGYSERYKNQEKKFMKKLFIESAKKGDMSQDNLELALSMLDDVDMSNELPCEKQELIEKITSSFSTENGREYTTASQYLTNQGCCKVFRETLSEMLSDGELRVCYDAGAEGDFAAFILYKINGKIIDGYLLKNEETGKFEIDRLEMCGDLYEKVKLTKTEKRSMVDSIREYNRLREDVLDIDRKILNYIQ